MTLAPSSLDNVTTDSSPSMTIPTIVTHSAAPTSVPTAMYVAPSVPAESSSPTPVTAVNTSSMPLPPSLSSANVSIDGNKSFIFSSSSPANYLLNNSLPLALQKATGYYKDAAKSAALNLEKLVLVTGGNFGYLNHIHNFNCFVERLGLKYLVISMELHTHYYLQRHGMISYYLDAPQNTSNAGDDSIHEQGSQFREKQFNLITNRKKKAVYDILALGYDVLFSDTDVIFRKDPLPYMLFKNVDYVHSLNMLCPTGKNWDFYTSKAEGNTGLYLVKSTNATRGLWYKEYEQSFKQPDLDDQTIFWKMIRQIKVPRINALKTCQDVTEDEFRSMKTSAKLENGDSSVVATCHLDECQFSAGMLRGYGGGNLVELKEQLVNRNHSEIITIHANFLLGNRPKMDKLQQNNLWLATLGEHESDDYFKFFGILEKDRPPKLDSDTHVGSGRRYWDGKCDSFDDSGKLKDGTLIKMVTQAETFIIKNGEKRGIPDLATFMSLGLDFGDVKTLAKEEFNVIPLGPPCPTNKDPQTVPCK